MNLSDLFIRRPIATTLIMLGIAVFGVMAYRLLPVSDLPTVDFPTIQVQAGLPGASPETMASAVALPLEKQFATIAGLDSMNSTSTQGNTSITLQFALHRDIDSAAADVQAMIARAARQLPQLPNPPSYNKVNPGDQPVIFLALRSATLPLSTVNEYTSIRAGCRRAASASTKWLRRFRTPTSTCRPARCSGRSARSRCCPTASCSAPPPMRR
jgi:HAE1 family hydrophobic/amphiphilic exporter-1